MSVSLKKAVLNQFNARSLHIVVILIFIFSGFSNEATAQGSEKTFTLYLVRHAEKELSADDPKDPPLTECGEQRAESLAAFLASVDLDAVYSTDYLRTRSTAQPVARDKKLEIQIYDPKGMEEFARLLIDRQEDALVVGHSNSTPNLAGLLLGRELESIDESIYDRIYQIVFFAGHGRLHLLHSSFVCNLVEE